MSAPRPYFDNPVGLDLDDVLVPERIGLFWPEKAAALGALMARDGQTDPIKVVQRRRAGDGAPRYQLVAGLHRLEGARLAGISTIQALVVADSDAATLQLLEASENVHRRDFGPIERALFVRVIADLAEARAAKVRGDATPQQIAAKARWDRARTNVAARVDERADAEARYAECQLGTAYDWPESAADSLGLSRRQLFRSLKIHRQLIAPFERELWDALARTALGQKQAALLELADIADADTRRLVIDTIVGDDEGAIISVADALVATGVKQRAAKQRLTGDSKFMNGAQANLARLTLAGWKSFAPALVEMAKPSALIALREAIDARLASLSDEGGDADA